MKYDCPCTNVDYCTHHASTILVLTIMSITFKYSFEYILDNMDSDELTEFNKVITAKLKLMNESAKISENQLFKNKLIEKVQKAGNKHIKTIKAYMSSNPDDFVIHVKERNPVIKQCVINYFENNDLGIKCIDQSNTYLCGSLKDIVIPNK